ncbi:integrase [Methylosinus sporium]|uniref:integrase n=1 Tax=Methylosinus sporium TaxID=428 RepID=UPI00383BDA32
MISKDYDAFVSAGAPEEKARRAAEALALYKSRFSKLEKDAAVVEWMLGVVIALLSAVALKLFLH